MDLDLALRTERPTSTTEPRNQIYHNEHVGEGLETQNKGITPKKNQIQIKQYLYMTKRGEKSTEKIKKTLQSYTIDVKKTQKTRSEMKTN